MARRQFRFGAPWCALALLLAAAAALWAPGAAQQPGRPPAIELAIDGAIGPATAGYIARGIRTAAERGAPLVVIRMDTPGGLDTAMRAIIRDILAAPMPVVTYVSPSGARAASAGTYILYASHVAAMAPGTNMGAATPVQIGGGGPFGSGDEDEENPKEGDGKAAADPHMAKAVNDAVAYIRALAELRGRNAEWAERAVRDAASLSADAALEQGVIDIRARTLEAVLEQADGRRVTIAGQPVTLDTADVTVQPLAPGWRTQLLAAITNPNVALILMMIGVYGLLFEFMNPGALYPGTIGAICLLVALYAFAALPMNYAGAALLLLGVGLMVAEGFAPSFGVLGIGGVLAFALGATMLIDADVPGFRIAWQVVAGLAVVSLAVLVAAARVAMRTRRRRVVSGREDMIGARGVVQDWGAARGHVFIHGERWNAEAPGPLPAGAPVRVIALEGLLLHVEPEGERNPP